MDTIDIFPVRCFSCQKVLDPLYRKYLRLKNAGKSPKECLDILGVRRYCCRQLFITHVPIPTGFIPKSEPNPSINPRNSSSIISTTSIPKEISYANTKNNYEKNNEGYLIPLDKRVYRAQ